METQGLALPGEIWLLDVANCGKEAKHTLCCQPTGVVRLVLVLH